jgi:predicted N-acyltransferase
MIVKIEVPRFRNYPARSRALERASSVELAVAMLAASLYGRDWPALAAIPALSCGICFLRFQAALLLKI